MKQYSIVCIGNNDIIGGASRAAFRLFKGLKAIGKPCKYVVGWKHSNDPDVIEASYDQLFKGDHPDMIFSSLVRENYIESNRTSLTNTFFSFTYPGYPVAGHDVIKSADIVNLHWIEHYLTSVSISQLGTGYKPLVWTLHDQRPFTGGCHYAAGCERFMDALCSDCPQLLHDPYRLPNAVLKDKIDLFKNLNLTVVTPSQWLAREARKSALFKNNRIEVIPNSIETEIYKPKSKRAAKQKIGIDPDAVTFLFAAVDSKEERKGYKYLLQALELARVNQDFGQLIEKGKIHIICMGMPDESIKQFNIPIYHTKYLIDDEEIVNVYNASDLYILPSTEDNLPNGILESMACSIPVIAFNIGGIPDLVDDLTGRLVEARNIEKLAESILELSLNEKLRKELGERCRKKIESMFMIETQAVKYAKLFEDILIKKENHVRDLHKPVYYHKSGASQYGYNLKKIRNKLIRFSFRKQASIQFPHKYHKMMLPWLFYILYMVHSWFPAIKVFTHFKIFRK